MIDTSLNACSVGLWRGDEALFSVSEVMTRGHQERIGVLAAQAFAQSGTRPSDVDHIGVTLGPGSFTGLRVGLSFAKGLASGLGLKLQGIGTLEALGHHPDLLGKRRLGVIDGGRGQIYVQAFGSGKMGAPLIFRAAEDLDLQADVLTGPGAHLLAAHFPDAVIFEQPWPILPALVALTNTGGHDDLTPLYMRDADAIASTRGIITLQA